MTCVSGRKAGQVTGGRKKKTRQGHSESISCKEEVGGSRIGGGPTSLCHLPL